MAKFRNRMKAKIRSAATVADVVKAVAKVGVDPEKQRAYIDKKLDALTNDQLYKVAMKTNAMLKTLKRDPCHVDQHEDCVDETCTCECHKFEHFVPFDPVGTWAWVPN